MSKPGLRRTKSPTPDDMFAKLDRLKLALENRITPPVAYAPRVYTDTEFTAEPPGNRFAAVHALKREIDDARAYEHEVALRNGENASLRALAKAAGAAVVEAERESVRRF